MSKKTETMVKSVSAACIAGGLAFIAVKSACNRRSHRMTSAKAFKMIGSLMDAF